MMKPFLVAAALTMGQAPAQEQPATEPAAADAASAPWLLMSALQGSRFGGFLEAHKLQISGWTDMSFTASSAHHQQLPLGFNDRANEFLLQQNWLRIEKPVSATEPSIGFRTDTILPGSDYRFTLARGIFDHQLTANDGRPNTYGVDPIQFYAEVSLPNVGHGLDVKLGRVFCQYGIEANDAPSNALLSHAYTFIYDPFTHTGAMATLKLSDAWSVQGGVMLGSDVFIDPAAQPTGMGGVRWAPTNGRDSVLLSVIVGPGRFDRAENFSNPNVFDLVYVHQFNDKLTYQLEGLFGYQSNVPDVGTARWFGVLNYLTRQFSDRLSATGRLEFFDDLQGQRTGFEGLYTAATVGLAYKPCRSIVIRPEIRYDYNGESRPFEGRHALFTAATDVILRW